MLRAKLGKKLKKLKKLGQTALEYFVTYSWAVALLSVIAVFIYINGVPGISYVGLKHANLDSFVVLDFKADTSGGITIQLANALNRPVQLTGTVAVNGVQKTITPIGNSSLSLAKGEKGTYFISSALPSGKAGEEFKISQLSLNYITIDSGLQHVSHGSAIGELEEVTSIEAQSVLLFEWSNQTDFDKGKHNSTEWNANSLVISSNNGEYTSDIRDAGKAVDWVNLSWTQAGSGAGKPGGKSLAALWSFDGDACDPSDKSGNGNNAKLQPNCTRSSLASGVNGKAMCLDGKTNRLNVSNSASLNIENMTIELWLYHDSLPNWYYLLEKGYSNQYRLGLTGNDKIRWLVSGVGEMIGKKAIEKKKWTHVIVTYWNSPVNQLDEMKIYVNGQLDSTFIGYGTRTVTSEPLVIGATKYNSRHFKGCVDEIRIYNQTLNHTDAVNSYKSGASWINFQARSCDDAQCNGELFTGPDGTRSSFYTASDANNIQALNLKKNRYVQFKTFLTTQNTTLPPKVYKVTIKAS